MNVKLNNLHSEMIFCQRDTSNGTTGAGDSLVSFRELMMGVGEKSEEEQEDNQDLAFDRAGADIFFNGAVDHREVWQYSGWMVISPSMESMASMTDWEREDPSKQDVSLHETARNSTQGFGIENQGLPEEGKAMVGIQDQEPSMRKSNDTVVSSAVSADYAGGVSQVTVGEEAKTDHDHRPTTKTSAIDSPVKKNESHEEKQKFSMSVQELSPARKENHSDLREGPEMAAVQGIRQETITHRVSFVEESEQGSPRAETYHQVSNEIMQRLDTKGPATFELQLEPGHLGKIQVKMEWKAGMLTIDILSARAETHTLLSSQAEKLIQSLGLQNVQVEMVQASGFSLGEQSTTQQPTLMNNNMAFSQEQGQRSDDQLRERRTEQAHVAEDSQEETDVLQRIRASSHRKMNLAV